MMGTWEHIDSFIDFIPICRIFHPIYSLQILITFRKDGHILILNSLTEDSLIKNNLIDWLSTVEIEILIVFS